MGRRILKNRNLALLDIFYITILVVLGCFVILWVLNSKNYKVHAAGTVTYTALGDSISSGFGLTDQNKVWVLLYNGNLANDEGVSTDLNNLGVPSLSSTELLNKLKTDATFRSAVSAADFITVDTGTVDWFTARWNGCSSSACFDPMLATFKSNFDSIIAEIKAVNTKSNLYIAVMNLYNPYISVDTGYPERDRYLQLMNSYIATKSSALGFGLADVHKAFNGASGTENPVAKNYIQVDGLHPSETGHGVIADVFRRVDTDGDACADVKEIGPDYKLGGQRDYKNKWDFYSVPVPALIAAPDPTKAIKDSAVGAGDSQSVFAYFKVGAKAGSPEYEQDLNNNGIKDGLEYDRSIPPDHATKPWLSGPPDGAISAGDAQLAFGVFKSGGGNCNQLP